MIISNSQQVGNFLVISWMLAAYLYAEKRVLALGLTTFVKKTVSGQLWHGSRSWPVASSPLKMSSRTTGQFMVGIFSPDMIMKIARLILVTPWWLICKVLLTIQAIHQVPFIYYVGTCIAQNLIWQYLPNPNFSQKLGVFVKTKKNLFPHYILRNFHAVRSLIFIF